MPTTLKLLTWNIWMMPPWIRESPKNAERAAAIGEVLAGEDFDILCLEKAFDADARRVLAEKLGARYPHRYGPVNGSGVFFKMNGGVWVLSRSPLTGYRELQFEDHGFIEGFARKGALLLTGVADGKPFQLIGTHLQGNEGPVATPENDRVRSAQVAQIQAELIAPHTDPKIPLFICGDFCTPRLGPAGETPAYRALLETFRAENGPAQRITLDDDPHHNDLATDGTGRVAELDYIFLRPGASPVVGEWERRIFQQLGWDGPNGRKDLSYRYAVAGRFTF